MSASTKPVPVNIVGGFLGVGKTTTLRYLLRNKPAHERWGVLVNEYGKIGLDGVMLEPDDRKKETVIVKELAGGCICCSAGLEFRLALVTLLRKQRLDRLLIEPTGMATMTGIIDTLLADGVRSAVELRSVIVLVDPAHWQDERYRCNEAWCDQIDAADILLGSRIDLSSALFYEKFASDAQRFYPPKLHIGRISRGKIDPKLLDLVAQGNVSLTNRSHHANVESKHTHLHDHSPHKIDLVSGDARWHFEHHHTDKIETFGWRFDRAECFDPELLDRWIARLRQHPNFLRLKGVFKTPYAWWLHNVTPRQHEVIPSAYRRDSRIEAIFNKPLPFELKSIEVELFEALKYVK